MKCGIVDVGSNTVQLSVYQYEDADFHTLFNQWETVGLAGYVKNGVLSANGMEAACRTLARFRALLDNLEIRDMYVFATASLRNISNSAQALTFIQEHTGIPVELLSGEEEATYSFRGAMLESNASTGLMVDIGGGSTELVAYENGAPISDISLPFGVVSLFSKYSEGLFPTAAEQVEISAHVAALLGEADGKTQPHLLGVGGTIRAVVGLCNARSGAGTEHLTVSSCQVQELYTCISVADKAALRLILKVAPDRIHTVLPGLIIIKEIISRYGVSSITMSATGVREGYLVSRVMAQ